MSAEAIDLPPVKVAPEHIDMHDSITARSAIKYQLNEFHTMAKPFAANVSPSIYAVRIFDSQLKIQFVDSDQSTSYSLQGGTAMTFREKLHWFMKGASSITGLTPIHSSIRSEDEIRKTAEKRINELNRKAHRRTHG